MGFRLVMLGEFEGLETWVAEYFWKDSPADYSLGWVVLIGAEKAN